MSSNTLSSVQSEIFVNNPDQVTPLRGLLLFQDQPEIRRNAFYNCPVYFIVLLKKGFEERIVTDGIDKPGRTVGKLI